MMYKLSTRFHFDAAHYLRGYKGRCANQHGHRWEIVLKIHCSKLNEIDIAVDFKTIKAIAMPVIDKLDHSLLNDHPHFYTCNPTAEMLSKYLYTELFEKIAEVGARLEEVEIWESPDCSVSYTE